MRASNEPLFWSLFSAGGMVAAMIIPVLIIVTGLLVPADAIGFDHLQTLFTNPLVKYGIRSIPTLLVFKGGEAVGQIIGFRPKSDLKKRLDAVL